MISEFLRALFSNKPENTYILVWFLQPTHLMSAGQKRPQNQSKWANTVEAAIELASKAPPKYDIYAGVGLSPKAFGVSSRCPQEKIAAIPGVWIDIDVGSEGHKKKDGAFPNPPTVEAALELVKKAVGVEPTMVVSTGGGIHVYWLFAEPWVFETEVDRKQAIALVSGLQKSFQLLAAAHGFSVDSTFNLDRVLRVPGTLNWKLGAYNPRECKILTLNESARYSAEDIETFVSPEASKIVTAKQAIRNAATNGGTQHYELIIDPNAAPPGDKFLALSEAEPRFISSWMRTRKDLKDTSPSGWDFALANYAVQAGWTDQEIVDLLVAARVKHKDDLKRPQYYRTTIDYIRVDANRNNALQDLLEVASNKKSDTPVRLNDDERADRLAKISTTLGVKIVRILRYKIDPPKYRLVTPKGEIELGAVSNLVEQTPLRHAIAATEGTYIRKFRAPEWNGIAQSLLDVCESYDVGPEGTDIGMTKGWLTVYFDENKPAAIDESKTAIANGLPYFDENGRVYFFLWNLRSWLKTRQDEKIGVRELGVLLRKVGCESEAIGYEGSTRNVWKSTIKVDVKMKSPVNGEADLAEIFR
jgi:hypothetical protein